MQDDIARRGKGIGVTGGVIERVVHGRIDVSMQGNDHRMDLFIVRDVGETVNIESVAGIADQIAREVQVLVHHFEEFDLTAAIGP